MVDCAIHIVGQAEVKATRLKEKTYVVCFPGDLFFPFTSEVFGALHSIFDKFLSYFGIQVLPLSNPLVSVVYNFLSTMCSGGTSAGAGLIIIIIIIYSTSCIGCWFLGSQTGLLPCSFI